MIPLYATENEIAALVFGRGRLREWRAFATIQERHGLPPIDPTTGRRFVPGVISYLYRRHGLDVPMASKADGVETWETKYWDYVGVTEPGVNVVPIGLRDKT